MYTLLVKNSNYSAIVFQDANTNAPTSERSPDFTSWDLVGDWILSHFTQQQDELTKLNTDTQH